MFVDFGAIALGDVIFQSMDSAIVNCFFFLSWRTVLRWKLSKTIRFSHDSKIQNKQITDNTRAKRTNEKNWKPTTTTTATIEQETTMSQQQYTSCYCFAIILIILCDKFCRVETCLNNSLNRCFFLRCWNSFCFVIIALNFTVFICLFFLVFTFHM